MIQEQSFEAVVSKSYNLANKDLVSDFSSFSQNEKLNISVPLHIEKWNVNRELPLVAVAFGIDETSTTSIVAFDCNGNKYLLDTHNDPDVAVIVVSNNERFDYLEEFVDSKTKGMREITSSRTNGNLEKVTYLKTPNLGAIEGWFYGKPEIRLEGVVYSQGSNSPIKAFTKWQKPKRKDIKNGYNPNQGLFYWYFDNDHGPNYFFQSFEIDDSGTTQTLSVIVSNKSGVSTSLGLNYKDQDIPLGGELISKYSSSPSYVNDAYLEVTIEN